MMGARASLISREGREVVACGSDSEWKSRARGVVALYWDRWMVEIKEVSRGQTPRESERMAIDRCPRI
jgi:hypothetical protein